MIELVFVACLTASPDVCQERVQAYLPGIGIMGCMVTAQQHIAQWAEAHPDERVVRWSCSWGGARELEA